MVLQHTYGLRMAVHTQHALVTERWVHVPRAPRYAAQGFTAAVCCLFSTCHRSPAPGAPHPHSSPPTHVPMRVSLSPWFPTGSPGHGYMRSPCPMPTTAP